MALLRVFPVWQLVPRFTELEIAPGTSLRDALGDTLGIFGERLEAVDREGAEAALDVAASELPELPDLALSLRPILHPLGLFEEAFSARSPGSGTATLIDSTGEGPSSWPLMTEQESRLSTGLQALGFGLDLSALDLERLAANFPELEGGWGVTQSSPYRFLIAAAAILSESEMASLQRLDVSTGQAADQLWTKLKLTEPDALDTRLHLFCAPENGGATLLRKYLEGPGSTEIPGRVRYGWRRVVVHPYRDDVDRLRQMANLARRLSVERRDSRLRRGLQNACSDFVTRYNEDAWLDHQAQVAIRPFEEKLFLQAQQLLLDHLARRLSDVEGASSGLAADLAFGMLRRCGFFDRQFETDGLRIGEAAWQLATGALRLQDRDLGGSIEDLDPSTDGALKDWIRSLGTAPVLLARADLDKIGKTVALDVACRLRFEIETLLETRTFPPETPAEIGFAQFLATLELLRNELDLLRTAQASGKLSSWLSEQEARLGAEVQRLTAQVVSTADFLFNVTGRFLTRLGMGDKSRYRRLAEAIEELRRTWLEWQCLQILLSGLRQSELSGLFDFATNLTARFGAMAQEIAVLKNEMAQELQEREKLAVLGAMVLELPLFPELEDRLRRAIEQLPLDAAFRKVFRKNGQLRNLFRLRPDVVMQELMDTLEEPLLATVQEIMAASPTPQLTDLLPAAIDQLFVDSLVQHSGRAGSVGAFDHQTHLVLILSPELARQFAEGEDLVPRIRRRLGEIGISQELPISLQKSLEVSGLILVRCVHALGIEELAG